MPGSCNTLQHILLKVPMNHLWAIFNSFRERLFQNVQYLIIIPPYAIKLNCAIPLVKNKEIG